MHNSSCAWYFPWPLAGQQQKVMALQTPVSDKISGVYPGSALNPLGALQVQSNLHIRPHHQHSQQQPSVIPHQRPHTPTPTPTPSPSVAYNFTPSLLNTHAQLQESATRYAVAAQATQGSLQGYARTHMLHPTMLSPLSLASCMAAAGTTSFGGVLPQQPTYGEPPLKCISVYPQEAQHPQVATSMNINLGILALGNYGAKTNPSTAALPSNRTIISPNDFGKKTLRVPEKRKTEDSDQIKDLKKAKLETKALKAKRPGFTDERYQETSYYIENGLRKVYPYYFTFTTFTKGRWVGEKILDIFAREFRAHPAEEYERCIQTGTLTVNFEKVPVDYRLKHNDLLANIVHRHEVPVSCQPITIVHIDEDIVVVNKPASIPVHPCGRYRHNTVVFILAKELNLKNLRTIHRLDRLTSGLLLFGRTPKKARQMEQQIRNRQVEKQYVCRVDGIFPDGVVDCNEPIQVVSYKIGVCKVSPRGKECTTTFQKLSQNDNSSVVLCKPLTGRMHQIRVHLQYLGYPIVNDPLYNHEVFGPLKGRGGDIGGKSDDELIRDLICIHNAENWLGIDSDSDISLFKTTKDEADRESLSTDQISGIHHNDAHIGIGTHSPESTPLSVESPLSEKESWTQKESTEITERMCNAAPLLLTQESTEDPVDIMFKADKMTDDKHCYECKVHYRDPKPKDLVMYLHAWKYKGPDWEYETELPNWARPEWDESEST